MAEPEAVLGVCCWPLLAALASIWASIGAAAAAAAVPAAADGRLICPAPDRSAARTARVMPCHALPHDGMALRDISCRCITSASTGILDPACDAGRHCNDMESSYSD